MQEIIFPGVINNWHTKTKQLSPLYVRYNLWEKNYKEKQITIAILQIVVLKHDFKLSWEKISLPFFVEKKVSPFNELSLMFIYT